MGKETTPFEDLEIAKEQVDKLFGCKILDRDAPHGFISSSAYRCTATSTSEKDAVIIHVKPTEENVQGFIQALKENRICASEKQSCDALGEYLTAVDREKHDNKGDWFPQTSTMRFEYDKELIRAYYLLGRHVAMAELNDAISDWLRTKAAIHPPAGEQP